MERIVFFGTPAFAVPTLFALTASGRRPALVVCQPTRRAGRGRRLELPPVAAWAEQHGVELWQPESVRDEEFVARLAARRPDLAVVVAFGQIFPRSLLAVPRHGSINLHGSLLPAYRGASPIAAAIAAGETTTGVTTMRIEPGLDAGPILLQAEVSIGPEETTADLAPRLAARGAPLIVETIDRLERADLVERPQGDVGVSYAPMIRKAAGYFDWAADAPSLANKIRALHPWPGTTTWWRGERVRLLKARAVDTDDRLAKTGSLPGSLLGCRDGALYVACANGGALAVDRLSKAGRRGVSGIDFWNGERAREGERFESAPEPERAGE